VIDSHCHLDSERFDADLAQVMARARAAGITALVTAGVDPDGWRAEDAIARRFPGVFVAYGVHPQLVAIATDAEVERWLEELARELEAGALRRPVALGETGLDRTSRYPRESLPRQEHAFRAQLRLARAYDLPVMLHVLQAHERALTILKEEGLPARGGVLHSYSGSAEQVAPYLELGLHFSFAGSITYSGARKPKEAARAVPGERLLVETDAPDQTPEARRPGRNEPALLPEIVEAVAVARGEALEDVARCTAQNARRLFRMAGER
jgi:TatD DNase family protein